jgi:hypothetical protein
VTPLFGPGWGNYALQGIVEIRLPEPVSLAPQTAGWWFLLLAVGVLVLRRGWTRYQRWLRDRYRREALAVLDGLRERFLAGDISAVRELAPTLRATACSAAGRDRVVGLQGDAWAQLLRDLAPDLEAMPIVRIDQLAYAPLDSQSLDDTDAIIGQLRRWVQVHEAVDA